ncbi:hypothetical protein RVY52_003918 [Burkholderia cenocepacia]|nr:hypothetical protein [Burkholderia cenocepacia]
MKNSAVLDWALRICIVAAAGVFVVKMRGIFDMNLGGDVMVDVHKYILNVR